MVDAEDLALAEDAECTTSWSARAEARSVPNGFSITHAHVGVLVTGAGRSSLSASMMTGKNSGAVER